MEFERFLWILVTGSALISESACEYCRGRARYEFGPNCEYMCHCQDWSESCDMEDGSCTSGCRAGKFGPGCQYDNAAYMMNVGSNIVRDPLFATDGQQDRCTAQSTATRDPYITVYLQNVKLASELFLIFKNYENATDFKVYIGKTPDLNVENLCAEDPGVSSENAVELLCSRRMEAAYLTVLLPGEFRKLEICQVLLNNGRTIEYKRQAYMSSVFENNEVGFGPGNAVNGEDRPISQTGTETTEDKTNPWWYVYFGGKRRITKIRIQYNTAFLDMMKNAYIFVCNNTDCSDKVYVHQDTSDPVPEILQVALPDIEAKSIGIQLLGEEKVLSIFQVEVFGGCPQNRCGMECRDLCFCKEKVKSMWDELNGNCPGECDRNWQKLDGKCSTGVCESGKFGLGCRYQCNCEDRCDAWTGSCLSVRNDSLERCKLHWFGTLCQGYNVIAESQFTVEGNTTYQSADLTVDGNITTCGSVLSGQGASWTAPLTGITFVDQIAVYVNSSRTGFGFEIMAENDNKAILCQSSWYESQGLYIAYCGHIVSTYVRVRTRSTMQICEVAVLDCNNGTFGDLCQNMCHCKDGAVCDKITGKCPTGGCETGYFGSSCNLECYPGYYGPDCAIRCGYCKDDETCDRITGWCESGCSLGWRGLRCDQECRDGTYDIDCRRNCDYCLDRDSCSAECRDGTYGVDCSRDCGYCLDGEACDKMNGHCLHGCGPGFQGANCSAACDDGDYGYNCNETCGSCRNELPCSKTDGECRNGCQLGKQPPHCQEDCLFGTYGVGCYGICGQCNYNQTCNPVTGVCDNGCVPGIYIDKVNPKCTKECANGYFGYNCTQRCVEDICLDTDICNKTNGDCLIGCKHPGYQAPKCTTVCSDGTYGLECQYNCGYCINQEVCNKTNGTCHNGCQEGFSGATCHTELPESLSAAAIVLLVFGIVLLLVGIAVVLIYFLVIKRRRKEKSLKQKNHLNDDDDKARNMSIISRVYENNINVDTVDNTNAANEKRSNENADNYNLSQLPKGTIAVADLWDYVLGEKSSKSEMVSQFSQLAYGLAHPCEAAKRTNDLRKNRYKEIFAYDHTRVKLHISPQEPGSDYINASFISGYNRPHMYIAAQGPTEDLIPDFWSLIWQQKCRKVVMLTKLVEQTKMRCAQYWPDDGEEHYGTVSVTLKESDSFADFDIRTFIINVEGKEPREVKQYHFTSWSDRQVPEYASSVVHFWSKVRTTDCKDNVPILVHCSAGIGRTGTYIALDYLVDQANVEGYVNVFQCVQNLRHQRVNMVQTQAQYTFLHEALVEALLCPSSAVPCERFPHMCKKLLEMDPKTRMTRLQGDFEKLQHVTKFRESQRTGFYDSNAYMAAKREDNREKNRCTTILPSDVHRPWLTSRVHERNDYINAVFLPSHREDQKFILTQNPLADTIVDFWRMVYENGVSAIVAFDKVASESEVYWAAEGETVTFIPFQVHHISEKDHVDYIERTMKLLNAAEPKEKPRIVKIFEYKNWHGESKTPSDTGQILILLDRVQKWQEVAGNQPLVVHCLNGAHKSGLFCVLASTIEQLKTEREVALAQILKQMRIRRHQIIPYYEQYKFCHDVILDFLRNFDTYSNFFI